MPVSAVAWLADASPNVQHTIASPDSGNSMPMRLARDKVNAAPTAFGKCEAIVLVCGGTHSRREPHTLWRPPEIGSSDDAHKLSSASNIGDSPKGSRGVPPSPGKPAHSRPRRTCDARRPRAIIKAPER